MTQGRRQARYTFLVSVGVVIVCEELPGERSGSLVSPMIARRSFSGLGNVNWLPSNIILQIGKKKTIKQNEKVQDF